MTGPSFAEFKALARRGNLVAIYSVLPSDLETPVGAFLKLERGEPHAFLLESAEQEETIGRYSFLAFRPALILTARGKEVLLHEENHRALLSEKEDLLSVMREILAKYRLANPEALPRFAGGFVGFLGYENVHLFERVALRQKNGLQLEDGVFFLVKDFLFFDHFRKTLSIVSLANLEGKRENTWKNAYDKAKRRIQEIEAKLARRPLPSKPKRVTRSRLRLEANLSRNEFQNRVRRIKEYIRAGDCIQVVFSQRFHLGHVQNDFGIYRALRSINPSPYMFYFRSGSLRLIGSSPELLVRKTDRLAELRPIAGTRPRGETLIHDIRREESLKRSPKEMAEHLMLVDLGRNDLGRVCEYRTVQVTEFARVERYSHVMHLVSDITGKLRPGKDSFDLIRATFPAGTVTGAPKIRAMEIIDELEPDERGPYAGCLGYFSLNHDMDMCITIRTIVIVGKEAYVQAGAGVVYDSQPRREYEETVNKAKALVQAVQGERAHGARHR